MSFSGSLPLCVNWANKNACLLYGHIKTAEQRTIIMIGLNTVIGTLAADGWAVTFGTARRCLGGLGTRPVPFSLYQMNSPPINGQCTNFILFDA